jgi:hypothetical protein
MSVSSSLNSFATSFGGSFSKFSMNGFQLDEILDDIRLEEGDINLPTVPFSQIRINEIVTQGSFKYYHGYVERSSDDGKEEKSYYAVKCLKGHNVKGGLQWVKETKLLAPLKHDNIRNIHSVSSKSLSDCLESETHELNVANRYFLVVDTIQETLKRRMDEWRLKDKQHGTIFTSFGGKRNSHGVDTSDAIDRVKLVGHDIAKAMVYLHSKNVAFGPLTPDKIGYDCHGTIKLMNFSAAQQVDTTNSKKLYGADVFSFGLLLWQLFTLEETAVDERPPLNGVIYSDRLREMIKQCWDKDLDQRPKFRRITKRLLEATSDCRHTVVQANKEEQVGMEYLQDDRPPSIRNLFLASPKRNGKKNFRISKVDLTLHLLKDPSADANNKVACDATVGTDGS